MTRVQLANDLTVSPLIHGHWRLLDWKLTPQELYRFVREVAELGITTIDQADIYGDYSCEAEFGRAIQLDPSLRDEIEIVSKCGIKLLSGKFPNTRVKHYDYSKEHIIWSVENSLQNLKTDYLDLLLLHRPSPIMNADEIASAFDQLKTAGKVLHFGVSNFTNEQFQLIDSRLPFSLVTNQIELSPLHVLPFTNGSLDFLQRNRVKPMLWSPFGGGKLFSPENEKQKRVFDSLTKVGERMGMNNIDEVALIWLMTHPSNPVPILGSGNLKRLRRMSECVGKKMALQDWFEIYEAAIGGKVP
ncbi:MAG: aldo/keto reductase [Schleiferiaceae bacterium]|jgi:predicted oxidoreductase|nr:aldo/keto reductase [Schleiferiaceae bacterium]